jgi:hypothetical protein
MFARTIVAFFKVSSPYESYNTLNSQGESRSAKRDEVPGPERRAGIAAVLGTCTYVWRIELVRD